MMAHMRQPEEDTRRAVSVSVVVVSAARAPHSHGHCAGIRSHLLVAIVVDGARSAGWILWYWGLVVCWGYHVLTKVLYIILEKKQNFQHVYLSIYITLVFIWALLETCVWRTKQYTKASPSVKSIMMLNTLCSTQCNKLVHISPLRNSLMRLYQMCQLPASPGRNWITGWFQLYSSERGHTSSSKDRKSVYNYS